MHSSALCSCLCMRRVRHAGLLSSSRPYRNPPQPLPHTRTCPAVAGPSHAANAQQPLGRYLVAASVWPAGRLLKGTATASSLLWGMLGQPGEGAPLALYRRAGMPGLSGSSGGEGLSFSDPETAAGEGGSAAGGVALRLCYEQDRGLPVAVLQAAPAGPSAAAALTTPTRGSAAAPTTPSRSTGKQGTPAAGSGSVAVATAGVRQEAEEWPLRLLSGSFDWSNEQQLVLLERLAARQLQGCWLLPGGY